MSRKTGFQKERSVLRSKWIKTFSYLNNFIFFVMALSAFIVMAPAANAQYAAFEDPQSAGQKTSGPDLKPSADTVEGGNLSKGDTAQVITLFKNVTNMPITVKAINLYPSANVTANVGTDNCSKAPVPPSAECAVTTNIVGINDGPYRVEILVDHDGRSRLSKTAITGTVGGAAGQNAGGESVPSLGATPEEVDFDELETKTPLVRSILMNNTTSSDIVVSSVELMADPKTGFSVSAPDCTTVEPGKSCLVTVMWTPYSIGKAEGAILVKHDGPKGITMIPVMGEYSPKSTDAAEIFPESIPGRGLIVSDHKEVDFGDEVDGAASITVSLVNSGDANVKLSAIKLAGSDNGLTLADDGCVTGMELEPLEACPLTVNWQPRREGPVIDDIQVRHDGVRGVLVIPIRGEAETPVVADQSLVSIQTALTTTTTSGTGIPRLSGAELQMDKLDSVDVPKDVPVITTTTVQKRGTLSLDGYKVTSHSPTRAVITGPFGRMIVNDGEVQMLGGYPWIVHIVGQGVELIGDTQVVLLVFDKSFTTKVEKEVSQIANEESSSSSKKKKSDN